MHVPILWCLTALLLQDTHAAPGSPVTSAQHRDAGMITVPQDVTNSPTTVGNIHGVTGSVAATQTVTYFRDSEITQTLTPQVMTASLSVGVHTSEATSSVNFTNGEESRHSITGQSISSSAFIITPSSTMIPEMSERPRDSAHSISGVSELFLPSTFSVTMPTAVLSRSYDTLDFWDSATYTEPPAPTRHPNSLFDSQFMQHDTSSGRYEVSSSIPPSVAYSSTPPLSHISLETNSTLNPISTESVLHETSKAQSENSQPIISSTASFSMEIIPINTSPVTEPPPHFPTSSVSGISTSPEEEYSNTVSVSTHRSISTEKDTSANPNQSQSPETIANAGSSVPATKPLSPSSQSTEQYSGSPETSTSQGTTMTSDSSVPSAKPLPPSQSAVQYSSSSEMSTSQGTTMTSDSSVPSAKPLISPSQSAVVYSSSPGMSTSEGTTLTDSSVEPSVATEEGETEVISGGHGLSTGQKTALGVCLTLVSVALLCAGIATYRRRSQVGRWKLLDKSLRYRYWSYTHDCHQEDDIL